MNEPLMNDPKFRNIHELLHELWTKAVGTPGYSKSLWKKLDKAIVESVSKPEPEMKNSGLVVNGDFAYRFVGGLLPDGCAELLNTAKAEGWVFLTRRPHEFSTPDGLTATGIHTEVVEYWYFKRGGS